MDLIKAHAYGNDFLYIPAAQAEGRDRAALARDLCARHSGVGADGVVFYTLTPTGARMTLFNADGSRAEVSGNGVRGLAAIICRTAAEAGRAAPDPVVIDTEAGPSRLTPLAANGARYTFRALMGRPSEIRPLTLEVAGERVDVVALSVGNPQCVVLGGPLNEDRLLRYGPALATHPTFPEGTNVSFVAVERPDRLRILIWERGVGPTSSSGTGACGAAVAAAAYGGAGREVDVIAPGGSQRVRWTDDGIYLTGWVQIVLAGTWIE